PALPHPTPALSPPVTHRFPRRGNKLARFDYDLGNWKAQSQVVRPGAVLGWPKSIYTQGPRFLVSFLLLKSSYILERTVRSGSPAQYPLSWTANSITSSE